jgi:hypothetical protein
MTEPNVVAQRVQRLFPHVCCGLARCNVCRWVLEHEPAAGRHMVTACEGPSLPQRRATRYDEAPR